MDSPELMRLLVIVLSTVAASVAVFAVISIFTGGEEEAEARLANVTESRANKSARIVQAEQASTRRKAVADTLKDLDERQKSQAKVSLRVRLERAGLPLSVQGFWIASVVCGLLLAAFAFLTMPPMHFSAYVAVAFIGVFGVPRWLLAKITKRRQNKFLNEFANAIDVIVRGVKSGLPLNECLQIIARESPSPIREEFRELVEQQRVGITLADAFDRMINRLPLPEVKFFAIVIGIQQQAGGNLSEALGNLANVLRDRKAMAAKVQALSAEAKASAAVLASLPFIVTILVYLGSPRYIELLWTTKTGGFLILCGLSWMTIGILVMKKMINFKY
jgi:tight adherence protein B